MAGDTAGHFAFLGSVRKTAIVNEIATRLRAKHPAGFAVVVGILAATASAKARHGMLAVGGALPIYPAHALTILARVAMQGFAPTLGGA